MLISIILNLHIPDFTINPEFYVHNIVRTVYQDTLENEILMIIAVTRGLL